MPINVPAPQNLEYGLYQLLTEILRRSVDGTNTITLNVSLTITNNDLTIATGGKGLILTSRDGNHTGRLLLENPDGNGNLVLSVDPIT